MNEKWTEEDIIQREQAIQRQREFFSASSDNVKGPEWQDLTPEKQAWVHSEGPERHAKT